MKLLFCFLLFPSIVIAQVIKPRNPVAPAGHWSNGLIRAYILSPADSTNGSAAGGVHDWSPEDDALSATDASGWQNGGNESPIFNCAGSYFMSDAGVWDMAGKLTDKVTIVQRLKVTCQNGGFCWSSTALVNGTTTDAAFYLEDVSYYDGIRYPIWVLKNDTPVQQQVTLTHTIVQDAFTTFIVSYGGDSLRAWVDGDYVGATAQSGNILGDSSYVYTIGYNYVIGAWRIWIGAVAMTCVFNRDLTSAERASIWEDPYIMFKPLQLESFYRRRLINGRRNLLAFF